MSKRPKVRNVQVAKRPGSESSKVVAKRPGGELTKKRNVRESLSLTSRASASYKGPFIATQLDSTDLLRADWLYAVQLGQLHCQSSATVELRR